MASWDLNFELEHHPGADEKLFARSLVQSGGGPAATAAYTAARLGVHASFIGYLGRDGFGEQHILELKQAGVHTDFIVRGNSPTPLSVCLVKPDGQRTVVSYREEDVLLDPDAIETSRLHPAVVLFDGHQRKVSLPVAQRSRQQGIPTILDAGSVHQGTQELMPYTDYLIASEKFARDFTGTAYMPSALEALSRRVPVVVITRGAQGLLWSRGRERGELPAFRVSVKDTTGAGDVFHGAFAAGLVWGLSLPEILRFASATAALACTQPGSRQGIPTRQQVELFLAENKSI